MLPKLAAQTQLKIFIVIDIRCSKVLQRLLASLPSCVNSLYLRFTFMKDDFEKILVPLINCAVKDVKVTFDSEVTID